MGRILASATPAFRPGYVVGPAMPRRRIGLGGRLLSDFCSVETSFILFLFSGWYKALPPFDEVPVDLTIFFLFLTIIQILIALFNGKMKRYSVTMASLMLIFFGLLAMTSLLWSSGDIINFDKAQRFLLLTFPSFFMAQMIGEDTERRHRFVYMLLCFSALFLAFYAYRYYILGIQLDAGQLSDHIAGDTYLEYGSDARNFFILCLVMGAFGPTIGLFAALPGGFVALYLMLVMGGRGPLLETLIALALFVAGFGTRGLRWSRRLTFCAAMITVAAIGYVVLPQSDTAGPTAADSFRTLWRIEVQLSGEDTSSMDERAGGRALAVHMWSEAPLLGQGFGEFKVNDPYLKYPHNLPLEIMSEMGVIGLLLFLGVFWPAVVSSGVIARHWSGQWTEVAIALIFVVDLGSHLTVEGYLADDRVLFAFAGLIIGYSNIRSSQLHVNAR